MIADTSLPPLEFPDLKITDKSVPSPPIKSTKSKSKGKSANVDFKKSGSEQLERNQLPDPGAPTQELNLKSGLENLPSQNAVVNVVCCKMCSLQ